MEAQWNTVPSGVPANWSLVALPNNKARKMIRNCIPNALGYILELKENYLSQS